MHLVFGITPPHSSPLPVGERVVAQQPGEGLRKHTRLRFVLKNIIVREVSPVPQLQYLLPI